MTSVPDPSSEITGLLVQASRGNKSAFDQLFPLVYPELKRLADQRLRHENPDHTLGPTALVHEAYLKLVDQRRVDWRGRSHFFAVSSEAMRRILVDHARQRVAAKRGAGAHASGLEGAMQVAAAGWLDDNQVLELVALDDALTELATFNPEGAAIVLHKFFGGLTGREIADLTATSERTVERSWNMARAWLRQRLGPERMTGRASLLGPGLGLE